MAKLLSPAKTRDYLTAAREAGFAPREAVILPDGGVRLVFADDAPVSSADAALAEWTRRDGARSA